jgi:uncharacterized membrane protein
MHQFLVTLHSYNRYLLLLALLFVLFQAVSGWMGRKPYTKTDNTAAAILLGLTHLQLLLGLILYAGTSPRTKAAFADMGAAMKDSWLRFFAVEHLIGMLLAVVLIQLGRTFSKRATDDTRKHRLQAIYLGLALLVIIGTLAPKGLLFGSVNAIAPVQ